MTSCVIRITDFLDILDLTFRTTYLISLVGHVQVLRQEILTKELRVLSFRIKLSCINFFIKKKRFALFESVDTETILFFRLRFIYAEFNLWYGTTFHERFNKFTSVDITVSFQICTEDRKQYRFCYKSCN